MHMLLISLFFTGCVYVNVTLQVRGVILVTYTLIQSATERFSVHVRCRGSQQVTTVCLVVDRWLFSLTLDVRQTTDN